MKIKTNVVPFMIEKKTLTDHKHLNQDGALGAHLLDIIDPFGYMHLQLSGSFFFSKTQENCASLP